MKNLDNVVHICYEHSQCTEATVTDLSLILLITVQSQHLLFVSFCQTPHQGSFNTAFSFFLSREFVIGANSIIFWFACLTNIFMFCIAMVLLSSSLLLSLLYLSIY